jgi:hypothetical protein
MEPNDPSPTPLSDGPVPAGSGSSTPNTNNLSNPNPPPSVNPTPTAFSPGTSALPATGQAANPATTPDSDGAVNSDTAPSLSPPLPPLNKSLLGVPVVGQPIDIGPRASGGPIPLAAATKRKIPKNKILVGVIAAVIVTSGIFGYVFGFYIPNKPANVYQTGLDRSGDSLAKLVDKFTEKEQLNKLQNSELTASVDAKGDDFTFSGNFGVKLAKTKADGSLDIKVKAGNEEEKALSVKFLSELPEAKQYPNLYFQIKGLKALGIDSYMPEIAAYEDKWIAVESDYLESIAGGEDEIKNRENVTAEEIASLIKVFSDTSNEYLFTSNKEKAVLENKAFIGKETTDGINTYHYQVGVNKAHAKDYCVALSERIVTHASYKKLLNLDDQDVDDQKKEINNECDSGVKEIKDDTTLDMWIDSKYKLIHKLRIYNEKDKGEYTDIGQTYTGGDKISFFVAYHEDKTKSDAKFTVDVDTKAYTSKGSVVWSQKSGEAYDVNITFEAKPYAGEVKVEKPANTISIQEILSKLGYDSTLTPRPDPPTSSSSSMQSKAKDTERQTDIKALHSQIESYYAQYGKYPTQVDLNNATWRTKNMRGLDEEALRDPDGTMQTLANAATNKQYGYLPESCTKADNGCQTYTLSALLSTGTLYTKRNLN